jgi:tetratricopeptide (TPR) repeat protein
MRTAIVTTLLVVMLTTVSQAALPAFNTSRFYSAAAFAAAIKPYTEAIAKNPNDADAHHWLGVAYLHGAFMYKFGIAPYARDYSPKAIASLERAVKLRPAFMASYIALMDAYSVADNREGWSNTVDRLMRVGRPTPLESSK